MIMFSVVAALLVAAALLFIVPSLWRRREGIGVQRDRSNLEIYKDQLLELEADLNNGILSQEQFEQGQLELERRLLEDVTPEANQKLVQDDRGEGRGAAITVMLLVPLLAVFIYLIKGTPAALSPDKITVAEQAGKGPAHAVTAEQINAMVQGLAARLEKNPQDADGWRMLGRSYVALGRYQDAIGALDKAVAMIPNDPDLLADYADALAMTSGQTLKGKPMEMVNRALKLDPNHEKSLWLAGTAAYNDGNYPGAIAYWNRLLKQMTPGSKESQQVMSIIAEAQDLASGKTPAPVAQATAAETSTAKVAGVVSLSPDLAGKVAPTDTVYIFAKAAQGPPMPLAAFRAQVKDLPIQFDLDDSMAPTPMAHLSDFAQVIVGARISKSGDPMPQSGDLQGLSNVVQVGSSGLQVKINSVVP
jgi:cytochrome c-type biogenesis protein CcmH